MAIKITPDWVVPYFNGKKVHKNYNKALDNYHHVSFHFDGFFYHFPTNEERARIIEDTQKITNPYFGRLIDLRRPSESSDIKAYRRAIYLPQTKSPCFKVYNSLRKIVKSEDWKIDYSKTHVAPGVPDDEDLEDYCETNYPYFDSVENWIYTYGFKHMLVDANAVIYVLPLDKENPEDESELYKPFTFIVGSKNVLDFKDDQYAVLESDRKNEYQSGDFLRQGKILVIITKTGAYEARQIKDDMSFELIQTHEYNLQALPAWKMGGIDKHFSIDGRLYESFIFPIIPSLDAAAREISDSDAEVVQHVYSTMWYYSSQQCTHCNGVGKVNEKGKQVVCTECDGKGIMQKSPYKDMVLNTGTFDGEKMPTPPAGYVIKPTDIVKLQSERIVNHFYNALSAINMEWLAKNPLNQSGQAKEVDRDELNNFVYGIAYHLVENILKPIYYFINELRYSSLVPSEEARDKMIPSIPIPTKYDILTANVIEQQLQAAVVAKVDPDIIDQLELEYVTKKFPNEPEVRDRLKLKKQLDPFPRLSVEEKNNLLLAKGADPLDVLVSNYLHIFLEKAFHDNPDFAEIDFNKQIEIIYQMGQEKLDKLTSAQKVKDDAKIRQLQAVNDGIKNGNNPNLDDQKSVG